MDGPPLGEPARAAHGGVPPFRRVTASDQSVGQPAAKISSSVDGNSVAKGAVQFPS
jgi:hypothetical protein